MGLPAELQESMEAWGGRIRPRALSSGRGGRSRQRRPTSGRGGRIRQRRPSIGRGQSCGAMNGGWRWREEGGASSGDQAAGEAKPRREEGGARAKVEHQLVVERKADQQWKVEAGG
nr:unnamed protein product [Digitaria exilis]